MLPNFSALFPAALAVLGITVVFCVLFSRLLRRPAMGVRLEAHGKPMVRFEPMERLLREEDMEFLRQSKGFQPVIARRLRAARVRIFRSYLDQLQSEFSRLHRALRLLTLVAGEDRPEVSRILLEQKLLFTFRLWEARARVILFQFGLGPVPVSGLVQAVEGLRAQVRQMQVPAGVQVPVAG